MSLLSLFKKKSAKQKLKNANLQINPTVHAQQFDYREKMKEIRKQSERLHRDIGKAKKTSERLQEMLLTQAIYQSTGKN